MEINPLSIILVKSDSKGDRMLFRYPHVTNHQRDSNQYTKRKNPYSMIITEDKLQVCIKNIMLIDSDDIFNSLIIFFHFQ